MAPRDDAQIDRELEKLWEKVDGIVVQFATVVEKLSNVERAIKTMADATGKAIGNLSVCSERGVELRHAKERIARIEGEMVSMSVFNNTIKDIRKEITDIKKIITWVGAAIALPLIAIAVQRMFG